MSRKYTVSILHNQQALRVACEGSASIKEALNKLGLRAAGGNYAALKSACNTYGVPFPKMSHSQQIVQAHARIKKPLETYLVENSAASRGTIKQRLIREGLLIEVCVECGLGPTWNNKSLTLQLDHINGVWDDNRLDNLRMLCPNCHSQTHSFAGRKPPKVAKRRDAPKPWLHRWSVDELAAAVGACSSWAAVCAVLGVAAGGRNYVRVQVVAGELGLDVAHLVRAPRVSRTPTQ